MTQQKKPSEIAEQYVRSTYPCIQEWISFVKSVKSNFKNYDQISCAQLALISNSAMKTFDYIQNIEANASVIRVSRMLNDLQTAAWRSWTSFSAQTRRSTGSRTISLTPIVLQTLANFQSWDNALNHTPSFNPPASFLIILRGVTL